MSGSAGLSSAKNRRSGNEVKIIGQNKPLPQQPQQQNAKQPQQNAKQPPQQNAKQPPQQNARQPQQQPQQMMQPPHPLEILKSHELRLRKIESEIYTDNEPTDENDFEQIFLAHKTDYNEFKNDYSLFKNRVLLSEKNKVATLEHSIKTTQVDSDLLTLHRRIDDLTRTIELLSRELARVKVCDVKVCDVKVCDVKVCDVKVCDVKVCDDNKDVGYTVCGPTEYNDKELGSTERGTSGIKIISDSNITEPNIHFEILDYDAKESTAL
uniref:Uncharacterized protein n=1 Tax=viral metagenome TaxID=1070528 RepID=A0A6C0IHA2_9ZZZZ